MKDKSIELFEFMQDIMEPEFQQMQKDHALNLKAKRLEKTAAKAQGMAEDSGDESDESDR